MLTSCMFNDFLVTLLLCDVNAAVILQKTGANKTGENNHLGMPVRIRKNKTSKKKRAAKMWK